MQRKRDGRLFILALALALLAGPVYGEGKPRPFPAKIVNSGLATGQAIALEEIAQLGMERLHTPGLGIGVVMGSTLVYEGYFGYASILGNRPVDAESLFRIGSISKSMTTIGLLQQWELGKFGLDDEVNRHLPKPLIFPPHPDVQPVNFRHLLTHTSGVGEFLTYRQVLMIGQGVRVYGYDYKPLAHYLRFGAHTRVNPGSKFAYSNYGFGFLGLALETISGEPFNDYMTEHVFSPLGMKDTTYQHTDAMLTRIVTGYSYSEKDGYRPRAHSAYGVTPPGSVYTTVPDFGLYVEALLNGGRNRSGRALKPETLAMMMSPQYTLDRRQRAYGFGLYIYGDIWGHHIVGHSGSVPFGHHSHMLLAPNEKLGVFVFGNGESDTPTLVCWQALKLLLGATDQPAPPIKLNREAWPELEGYYGPRYRDFKTSIRIYVAGVGTYQVKIVGDELKLISTWQGKKKAQTLTQATPDDPYFFLISGEDTLGTGVPAYASFRQDPDGAWYFIPGGLEEFVRLGPTRILKARLLAPAGRVLLRVNPF